MIHRLTHTHQHRHTVGPCSPPWTHSLLRVWPLDPETSHTEIHICRRVPWLISRPFGLLNSWLGWPGPSISQLKDGPSLEPRPSPYQCPSLAPHQGPHIPGTDLPFFWLLLCPTGWGLEQSWEKLGLMSKAGAPQPAFMSLDSSVPLEVSL